MRKFIVLAAIVLGFTLVAGAQEVPQVEVFGGYSLFHFDKMDADAFVSPTTTINQNVHGWNGSVQYNINKWLGAVADFSGHYGTPAEDATIPASVNGSIHNFLFGPQVNVRGKRLKGFGHVLFGVNRLKFDASPSFGSPEFTDNAFGMAIGGGVDVTVYKKLAVRVGQLDYIYSNHDLGLNLGHQNNLRYSAGVVFNLGQK